MKAVALDQKSFQDLVLRALKNHKRIVALAASRSDGLTDATHF